MATIRQRQSPKLAEVSVIKREDVTGELLKIWLEKPEGYIYKPGQYCTIGIDGVERAYSIVSAPSEDALELFVELVPREEGGNLTPMIWDLHEGDTVSIRPRAKGIFVFNPDYKNHLMVATVTGVVPYISILRQYLRDNAQGHRMYVLMGASYCDEFTYDVELNKIAAERSDILTFVPCVSRPTEERNSVWTGETGRVNTVLERYTKALDLNANDTLIYACGHPGMIEDIKERMTPQGWNVTEERFWKDD